MFEQTWKFQVTRRFENEGEAIDLKAVVTRSVLFKEKRAFYGLLKVTNGN